MLLYTMNYAGGTKEFFTPLEKELSEHIILHKIEYAGHGERKKEKFYSSFAELAEDMYIQIRKDCAKGVAYALFGYSMGSISVIETLKLIIERDEIQRPQHIFLAAHEPCTRKELLGFSENELDEWIKERTISFEGIPTKLINNKTFWRVYLPVYKADYSLISSYCFEKLDLCTSIPLTVFYSETDTPLEKMKLWNYYFKGDTEYLEYKGTHFFLKQFYTEIADIINDRIGDYNYDV